MLSCTGYRSPIVSMWGKRGAAAALVTYGLLVLAISDTPTRTSSSRTATVVSRTATASKEVCIRARLAGLAHDSWDLLVEERGGQSADTVDPKHEQSAVAN